MCFSSSPAPQGNPAPYSLDNAASAVKEQVGPAGPQPALDAKQNPPKPEAPKTNNVGLTLYGGS